MQYPNHTSSKVFYTSHLDGNVAKINETKTTTTTTTTTTTQHSVVTYYGSGRVEKKVGDHSFVSYIVWYTGVQGDLLVFDGKQRQEGCAKQRVETLYTAGPLGEQANGR